jgi:hypothetical protein
VFKPWGYQNCNFTCLADATQGAPPDTSAAVAQITCNEAVFPCYYDKVNDDKVCDVFMYWPYFACRLGA